MKTLAKAVIGTSVLLSGTDANSALPSADNTVTYFQCKHIGFLHLRWYFPRVSCSQTHRFLYRNVRRKSIRGITQRIGTEMQLFRETDFLFLPLG